MATGRRWSARFGKSVPADARVRCVLHTNPVRQDGELCVAELRCGLFDRDLNPVDAGVLRRYGLEQVITAKVADRDQQPPDSDFADGIQVGQMVCVGDSIEYDEEEITLEQGLVGVVQEVDDAGDALVRWGGQTEHQWVLQEHFAQLNIVPIVPSSGQVFGQASIFVQLEYLPPTVTVIMLAVIAPKSGLLGMEESTCLQVKSAIDSDTLPFQEVNMASRAGEATARRMLSVITREVLVAPGASNAGVGRWFLHDILPNGPSEGGELQTVQELYWEGVGVALRQAGQDFVKWMEVHREDTGGEDHDEVDLDDDDEDAAAEDCDEEDTGDEQMGEAKVKLEETHLKCPYVVGASAEVLRSDGRWSGCIVLEVLENGAVNVQTGDGKTNKKISPEKVDSMLRRIESLPGPHEEPVVAEQLGVSLRQQLEVAEEHERMQVHEVERQHFALEEEAEQVNALQSELSGLREELLRERACVADVRQQFAREAAQSEQIAVALSSQVEELEGEVRVLRQDSVDLRDELSTVACAAAGRQREKQRAHVVAEMLHKNRSQEIYLWLPTLFLAWKTERLASKVESLHTHMQQTSQLAVAQSGVTDTLEERVEELCEQHAAALVRKERAVNDARAAAKAQLKQMDDERQELLEKWTREAETKKEELCTQHAFEMERQELLFREALLAAEAKLQNNAQENSGAFERWRQDAAEKQQELRMHYASDMERKERAFKEELLATEAKLRERDHEVEKVVERCRLDAAEKQQALCAKLVQQHEAELEKNDRLLVQARAAADAELQVRSDESAILLEGSRREAAAVQEELRAKLRVAAAGTDRARSEAQREEQIVQQLREEFRALRFEVNSAAAVGQNGAAIEDKLVEARREIQHEAERTQLSNVRAEQESLALERLRRDVDARVQRAEMEGIQQEAARCSVALHEQEARLDTAESFVARVRNELQDAGDAREAILLESRKAWARIAQLQDEHCEMRERWLPSVDALRSELREAETTFSGELAVMKRRATTADRRNRELCDKLRHTIEVVVGSATCAPSTPPYQAPVSPRQTQRRPYNTDVEGKASAVPIPSDHNLSPAADLMRHSSTAGFVPARQPQSRTVPWFSDCGGSAHCTDGLLLTTSTAASTAASMGNSANCTRLHQSASVDPCGGNGRWGSPSPSGLLSTAVDSSINTPRNASPAAVAPGISSSALYSGVLPNLPPNFEGTRDFQRTHTQPGLSSRSLADVNTSAIAGFALQAACNGLSGPGGNDWHNELNSSVLRTSTPPPPLIDVTPPQRRWTPRSRRG